MKTPGSILLLLSLSVYACVQMPAKKAGGACEGCEAIHESPIEFANLPSSVTLPDFNDAGPKIEISGIVYQRDGKTPARDVVLYVYHTNQKGIYPTRGTEKGWGKRHGYIRGWVKTDANGFYQFYTLRPAAYPDRKDPQHIHVTVKEPDRNEYYIDEYVFADDPLLPKTHATTPRGGDGVIKLLPPEKNIQHATRHIILGLNIPDYPYAGLPNVKSGLAVGENCPAFDPLHLTGADTGTKACPMCKYGFGQGVMVWINHANVDQLKNVLLSFEQEMKTRGAKNFRVFLMYMNPLSTQNSNRTTEDILKGKLKKWCGQQNLQHVAFTWVPSPTDKETAGLYNINPQAKNTVLVYKKRKVTAKWVNIEYDDASVKKIMKEFE